MAKKKSAKKKSAPKKTAKKKGGAMKAAARGKKVAKKKPAPKAKVKAKAKQPRPKARKRELIDTGTDKRYVRRNDEGQFQDVVDVSRSLAADIRQPAETLAGPGQGDKGD